MSGSPQARSLLISHMQRLRSHHSHSDEETQMHLEMQPCHDLSEIVYCMSSSKCGFLSIWSAYLVLKLRCLSNRVASRHSEVIPYLAPSKKGLRISHSQSHEAAHMQLYIVRPQDHKKPRNIMFCTPCDQLLVLDQSHLCVVSRAPQGKYPAFGHCPSS